ncbi:ABC transporter ATP-binding protein [Kineococcus sp. SYSU DK001]|uniref:ABC transporter ATP-binding protein n=1 Tax=Kineococcus sp. SYSU DK001 TaxID=3383122 RepID=UPI003D7D722D
MDVIEMSGVAKTYGAVRAVDGLDLRVREGEVVALLGPNGAGKSTTFELLLDLVRPTTGTVRVLGGPPSAARARVGAMLQSAGLPEQVIVRELVRLVGHAYPHHLPVADVLDRTGLTTRATRTVTALSGGERQRLLLALALVGEPELLLLDEPTAAMDVLARRAFWAQARAATAAGATILFATHDLTEAAAVADRVVVLAAGRCVADGTPQALAGDGDLETAYLTLTDALAATGDPR